MALLFGVAAPAQAEGSGTGPDWLLVVTPTGGWLNNEVTFNIKVPQGSGGEIEYEEQKITLKDDGWGLGLTTVGFYKRISLTNVFFMFPKVNESRLIGNITYLAGTIPTGVFLEPYLGLGLVWVDTQTDYRDFNYRQEDTLFGEPAVGFAHFERMAIDNRVIAPFPKVGAQFNIPIQHWYVTPFYSLMYEDVNVRARGISTDNDSEAGDVQVWYESDLEDGRPPKDSQVGPAVDVKVDPFDKRNPKEYLSNLVGTDFFLDFHYFLQLRGKVYYNIDYNLWTIRLIGSVLLNEWFGISAYFEYSQKITVTNTYLLIGPAFVLMPRDFAKRIRAQRDKT